PDAPSGPRRLRLPPPRSTLLLKILGALVATLLLATAVTGLAVAHLTTDALTRQARALASSDLTVLQTAYTERERVLIESLRRVAQTANAGELTRPERRPALVAELAVLQRNLGLDVLQVLDAGGSTLLSTAGADVFAAPPERNPLNTTRLLRTRSGSYLQAAVVAVHPGDASPLLVGGYEFGDGFAHALRRRVSSRDDVVLVADGAVVGTTLPDATGLPRPGPDPEPVADLVDVDGVESLVQYVPIAPAQGPANALGVVLRDPVALLDRSLARGRLAAGAILSVLVLGLGWLFFRALTRPLVALTGTAELVARGDLEATFRTRRRDEIGRLAGSLQHMTDALRRQAADLRESARRIVSAQDSERRRLARDLHDGAQQRLVSLSLALELARRATERGEPAAPVLAEASGELAGALSELRELARGIHPAVLTDGGLGPAIESLAERSPVPATVAAVPEGRFPGPVEATAYFIVSEALANVAKYAGASEVAITVRRNDGTLLVEVADDGVGGADPARGSGLQGLADRAAALGGRLRVDSPPGRGTRVVAEVPCA
ncbi:MAG: histidine kinase, partial [Actinomycetota bacterium]